MYKTFIKIKVSHNVIHPIFQFQIYLVDILKISCVLNFNVDSKIQLYMKGTGEEFHQSVFQGNGTMMSSSGC